MQTKIGLKDQYDIPAMIKYLNEFGDPGLPKFQNVWEDLLNFYCVKYNEEISYPERQQKYYGIKGLHKHFNKAFKINLIESEWRLRSLVKGRL